MLELALATASERGYESMRIAEITDAVGVTRQAFYAHFRDKRHCLCEAIDPRLASIERIASAALRERDDQQDAEDSDARWSTEILRTIDESLAERFGSREGTRGRLLEAMATQLAEGGSLAAVRIGKLVRAAHVPQGDFYRCFTGKRECFAVLYESRLRAVVAELEASTDPATTLADLGRCLDSDRRRLELLVRGASELPSRDAPDLLGSRQGALADAIAELLAGTERIEDPTTTLIAGSLVELIRSTLIAERLGELERTLPRAYAGLVEGRLGEEGEAGQAFAA